MVYCIDEIPPVGWRRILMVCVAAIFLGVFIYAAVWEFRAGHLAARTDGGSLEKAIRLEPASAEYHLKLSEYRMLVDSDPAAAAEQLRIASSLEPTNAQIWLALARIYYNLGEDEKERVALDTALQEAPTTPSVAWEVALFRVVHGDVEGALPQLHSVLMSGVIDSEPVLDLAWRVTKDPARMLDRVVPADPEHYSMFLDLLLTKDQPEAAAVVWKRLVGLRTTFPPQAAFGYIDYLIDHHNAPAASSVWNTAVGSNPSFRSYLPTENLIVNSSFADPILNGGFDWRYKNEPGIQLSVDTNEVRLRSAAMSVNFDNSSVDDVGIMQWVAVEPNTAYEFSGFMKATDLIGAAGPRFELTDAYDGTSYFLSEDITGTTGWVELKSRFRTGQNTHLLGLRVVRQAKGSELTGRLWLSDLSLAKVH